MKMNSYIKKLYKKFLYGNITQDEFMEMRHFVNEINDDELSNAICEEWNENILTGSMDDTVKNDIRDKLNFYIECDKKKIRRSRLFKVAAVLVPFIVIGTVLMFIFLQPTESGSMIVSVDPGNKALVTLPDQTKVWLNANSHLEYSQADRKLRHVTLTGEAFFKVAEDKSKPFIVSVNMLEVEVLGTSFNVKAREYLDATEVSLVEGSIKLRSSNLSHDYYLKPNEKATFSNTSNQLQIMHTDNDLETAWMYNRLKFSSERFADVLIRLEEWYGVKILNNYPDISNDLISGTFREERIENALQALQIQYQNLQFKRQKDTIVIYKN